jgi:hypothetical protein
MAAHAFPFICLPDAAIWKPGLSAHAKWLFSALIARLNRKTGVCNPKLGKLAEQLGKSLSTIKRALAELRRAGMVICRRTLWGNHYEIATPDRWQAPDSEAAGANSFGSSVSPAEGSPVSPHSAHRRSHKEPDVLEPDEGAAAAAPSVAESRGAAAAATPPPRVQSEPEPPALPQVPVVQDRIPGLARAIADELLKVHPQPGLPRRAGPEIEKILRACPNVEATAECIWNNHAAWVEYWKTLEAHRFIPQLWRWFNEGDWEKPPVIRKPATKESRVERGVRAWDEARRRRA